MTFLVSLFIAFLFHGALELMLALTPWKIEDYLGTEQRGPGLDHIGFRVEASKD
jgi:hypothetical protein